MVSIDAARDGAFLRPFPARRLRLRRAPLPPPDRGVWGFPTHALGRDTHAPIPPPSATRWARDRRPGRGGAGRGGGRGGGGGVPARRRAVAAREEDLSERRGGAAWRGVARRNANFVVVEVGGEGTRWTVDGGVGWLRCGAVRCGASSVAPSRYVSVWLSQFPLPTRAGWGAGCAAGVGGEGEASSRRASAWTRSVVGGWSFLPVVAFLVGWGPRFRPCRWGLGTARGNL